MRNEVYQCLKYLYKRNCLPEMKGTVMTVVMRAVLLEIVVYVGRYNVYLSNIVVITIWADLTHIRPPKIFGQIILKYKGVPGPLLD